MSECVVRMKTPSSCYVCPLRIACVLYKKWLANEADMPCVHDDGCLIGCALPENHGRLVDVNIVEKKIKDAEELSEFCDEFEFGGRWTVDLSKIPTIVPATERRANDGTD